MRMRGIFYLVCLTEYWKQITTIGRNNDQLNEKKQRLFIEILLSLGSQPSSLVFWWRLQVGQKRGKA